MARAISSDSAAPSTKAYCPLMGNLQGEFDFFIKNQQPKDEKKLPPSTLTLVLLFHVSCSSSAVVKHFLLIFFLFYAFFPLERKALWFRVGKVTATQNPPVYRLKPEEMTH